jgi:hypothetical protein
VIKVPIHENGLPDTHWASDHSRRALNAFTVHAISAKGSNKKQQQKTVV